MLKKINVSTLYETDFNIKILNILKQYWKYDKCFSCINNPKKQNNFTYLKNCTAEYTLKNGNNIKAESGDIVYTPTGAQYKVEFTDFVTPESFTIGINFHLYESDLTPFVLTDDVTVFRPRSQQRFFMLFSEMESLFTSAPSAKTKSLFYELMSELSSQSKNDISMRRFSVIEKGIRYIESAPVTDKSIHDIAKMCCVSEIYFRKLFREYSGYSPMEYIMKSKIEKARRCLRYDNLTVAETSEACGFESAAHFSKMFKRKTGLSPLQYKKSFE